MNPLVVRKKVNVSGRVGKPKRVKSETSAADIKEKSNFEDWDFDQEHDFDGDVDEDFSFSD